jgi:hypothetical protein
LRGDANGFRQNGGGDQHDADVASIIDVARGREELVNAPDGIVENQA